MRLYTKLIPIFMGSFLEFGLNLDDQTKPRTDQYHAGRQQSVDPIGHVRFLIAIRDFLWWPPPPLQRDFWAW